MIPKRAVRIVEEVEDKVNKVDLSIIQKDKEDDSIANEIIENMTFSNKDHDEDKNTDEVLTQKSGPLSSCRSNLRSARSSKGFVSGSYTDRDEIPVEKSMDSYNLEEIDPNQLP